MGRNRSDFICPKCGKQGSLRRKKITNSHYKGLKYYYRYVEHYDSVTNKKSSCYVERLINDTELENISNSSFSEEMTFLYNAKKRMYEMSRISNKFVRKVKGYNVNPEDNEKIYNAINEQIEIFLSAIEASIAYARLSLKGNLTTEEQEIWENARKVIHLVIELGEQLRRLTEISKQGEINLSDQEKFELAQKSKLAIWFLKQPYITELANFREKYEEPILRLKKSELRKKLSEAALGSDKYRSQYSGISGVS